jgi:ribosomal protein S18 acetylase RimI-like enzyme
MRQEIVKQFTSCYVQWYVSTVLGALHSFYFYNRTALIFYHIKNLWYKIKDLDKMIIKLVTKKDVARIADMYYELYCHVYKRPNSKRKKDKLIEYVEVRLKKNDYFIYKATIRKKIVGTIALKLLSSKRGYITGAYVEPDFRRNKILTDLEERALMELRNRGANRVELDVKSDNHEGMSTWNALGYHLKKRVAGKRSDKLIMIKELK